MGLAIDGNEVHGIARGGQAFVSIGNTNADGSISLNGQDYLNESNMEIKDTGKFYISIGADDTGGYSASPVDVTNELSNYGGYLARCVIYTTGTDSSATFISSDSLNVLPTTFIISHPIIIPTASILDVLSL